MSKINYVNAVLIIIQSLYKTLVIFISPYGCNDSSHNLCVVCTIDSGKNIDTDDNSSTCLILIHLHQRILTAQKL